MAAKSGPLRAADVRHRNEKLVLRLIHSARDLGLSQSEVVLSTGLKPPTIFRIFSALEAAGHIEPVPQDAHPNKTPTVSEKKGRPPVSYRVKAGAFYSIGVEFWVEQISFGIFDFQGRSILSRTLALDKKETAGDVVDILVTLTTESMKSLEIPASRMLGIGIGAPGQVDVGNRSVTSYPRIPGMKDFPIAALLEKRLGFSVYLHNNCSIIALSEFRYGQLGEPDSLFMFLLRSGVNGAFVDGGKIFLSPRGTTIEMGHISIDHDGPECICGARGCLEAFISSQEETGFLEGAESGHWLFEKIEGRDQAERMKSLDAISGYLASAVQTVSRLFKPSAFLFVTHTEDVASEIARQVGVRVAAHASTFDETPPRFHGRAYNADLAQRGAADLVVDSFLS